MAKPLTENDLAQLENGLAHLDSRVGPGYHVLTASDMERLLAQARRAIELEARVAELEKPKRRFPIMGGPSIPWEMIAPYESQAQSNHQQSLERLAERGGLDPSEALAVLESRRWHMMDPKFALASLAEAVRRWEARPLLARISELETQLAERAIPTHWTSNGEAGDGQTVCDGCETPVDDDSPHAISDCRKVWEAANGQGWHAAAVAEQQLAEREGLGLLARMRAAGWCVAVHNDYRLHGESFTFWGFTRDGRFVKGEGRTDEEALRAALEAVDAEKGSAP